MGRAAIVGIVALVVGLAIGHRLGSRTARSAPPEPQKPPIPGPATGAKAPTEPLAQAPSRHENASATPSLPLDLGATRSLVMAGDLQSLRKLKGRAGPGDVEELQALLSMIPPEVGEERRHAIQDILIDRMSIPGEVASAALLQTVLTEGLLDDDNWNGAVSRIGERKYIAAIPQLEAWAFGADNRKITYPAAALMKMDRDRYLPRFAELVRTTPEDQAARLKSYVASLRAAAWHSSMVDIAPAVPALQGRFWTLGPDAGGLRMSILGALETYRKNFRSADVRRWMMDTLRASLSGGDPRSSSQELDHYRAMLDRLDADE